MNFVHGLRVKVNSQQIRAHSAQSNGATTPRYLPILYSRQTTALKVISFFSTSSLHSRLHAVVQARQTGCHASPLPLRSRPRSSAVRERGGRRSACPSIPAEGQLSIHPCCRRAAQHPFLLPKGSGSGTAPRPVPPSQHDGGHVGGRGRTHRGTQRLGRHIRLDALRRHRSPRAVREHDLQRRSP